MRPSENRNERPGGVERREFLRSAGRWVGIGALTALFGRSLLGPKGRSGALSICSDCPSLGACRRPEGVAARRALGRELREDEPAREELCMIRNEAARKGGPRA